nr:unnamed protein product [Callosobruchus chinensis]
MRQMLSNRKTFLRSNTLLMRQTLSKRKTFLRSNTLLMRQTFSKRKTFLRSNKLQNPNASPFFQKIENSAIRRLTWLH